MATTSTCSIVQFSFLVAVRKIFKEDAKDDKIRRAICCWLQQAKARRSRR